MLFGPILQSPCGQKCVFVLVITHQKITFFLAIHFFFKSSIKTRQREPHYRSTSHCRRSHVPTFMETLTHYLLLLFSLTVRLVN